MSTQQTIGFIGAGNMAGALLGGLIAKGYSPDFLWVSDPNADKEAALRTRYGLQVAEHNSKLAANVDIVVLAVKPQSMAEVCGGLRGTLPAKSPLWISIAAGIRSEQIANWLGRQAPIVRAMPNTPALVGSGATGLFANAQVSDAHKQGVSGLFESVGQATWITDEAQMDVVTALSGSGPAYFFYFIEQLISAATAEGLPREAAQQLAVQTALGAAKMAQQDTDISALRERVTSPGGTTAAGLEEFQSADFERIIRNVIQAATARGEALSHSFSSGDA